MLDHSRTTSQWSMDYCTCTNNELSAFKLKIFLALKLNLKTSLKPNCFHYCCRYLFCLVWLLPVINRAKCKITMIGIKWEIIEFERAINCNLQGLLKFKHVCSILPFKQFWCQKSKIVTIYWSTMSCSYNILSPTNLNCWSKNLLLIEFSKLIPFDISVKEK